MAHLPIAIVDANDQVVGAAGMEEAHKKGLWHRVVRILIEDEKGRVLLQKRSSTMAVYPNCWDTSASGHVDEGEDYLAAAIRETYEEIGIKDIPLEEIASYKSEGKYEDRIINRFNKTYRARLASTQEFHADPDEVAALKWFDLEELKELIRNHPDEITDGLEHEFSRYE